MKNKLVVEFTKMNGAGNDFVVIDNRFYHFDDEELATIARAMCPRRTGIGADGVLALSPSRSEDAHFRMRYMNADGSIGTMCGNGARCLAHFAYAGGIDANPLYFETDAGLHAAGMSPSEPGRVRLSMVDPKDFRPHHRLTSCDVDVAYVWTGTEHVVSFVSNVEEEDVQTAGRQIRHDSSLLPTGANVNFVEVMEGDHIRVRTYEKGVEAETAACGTGAVASALAAHLAGKTSSTDIHVVMNGGTLEVSFDEADGEVRNVALAGPVEVVYRGSFEWG